MRLAISFLFAFLVSTVSLASSPGNAHTNCAACHSGGSTPVTQFLVNGVATTSMHVQRGATLQLAFAISSPTASRAGFSVRTMLGSLTPGSGQHYHTGTTDITHNTPKVAPAVGAVVTFPFSLTTSASVNCGSVGTLHGWGSAVNGNGSTSGDGNQQATLTFTVDCPAETTTPITTALKPLPALMLTQKDAADLLMTWLKSGNYYRGATVLLVPANGRSQDQYWIFDLVVQACPSVSVDTWRVDTVTKGMTRLATDGKYVQP